MTEQKETMVPSRSPLPVSAFLPSRGGALRGTDWAVSEQSLFKRECLL